MRVVLVLAALVLAIAGNLAVWGLANRATVVGTAGEGMQGGKWRSLSFAPFRDGQSPLTRNYPSAAEIEQDIAFLSHRTQAIRTYTSLEGMQAVPALAAKYGLKMTAGAWLGSVLSINQQEVTALIQAARAHPKTITRVIVGNEVLLRGDLTPTQLAGYIRQVRLAVKQPVSYADVWEFWMKHPELAKDVDFITIHILPYWENNPVSVANSAAHIEAVYRMVQQRFPGKPILIGEVGWPTAGRSRAEAVPGLINRARFFDGFFRLADRMHLDYNMIEAFDQPWKSALEGTVGANWGFYDHDRAEKFALGRPISDNPNWWWQGGLAALFGLVPALVFLRRRPGFAILLAYAALSQLMGSLVAWAGAIDLTHSYSPGAEGWSALKLVVEAGLALAILGTARRLLSHDDSRPPSTIYEALARDGSLAAVADGLYLLLTLGAVALAALLLIDPRYRDFPIPDVLVPTVGLLGFKAMELWQRGRASLAYGRLFEASTASGRTQPASTPMRAVSAILTVAIPAIAIGILVREGIVNREAVAFAVIFAALALPYGFAWLGRERRPPAEAVAKTAQGA